MRYEMNYLRLHNNHFSYLTLRENWVQECIFNTSSLFQNRGNNSGTLGLTIYVMRRQSSQGSSVAILILDDYIHCRCFKNFELTYLLKPRDGPHTYMACTSKRHRDHTNHRLHLDDLNTV